MILPRPLRTLLYPLSVFYEKIVRVRAGLYEKGRLRQPDRRRNWQDADGSLVG